MPYSCARWYVACCFLRVLHNFTLQEMINKDFQEYPEHRIKFFLLLRAITEHCTQGLISLQGQQFQLYMDRCAGACELVQW